ncbi:perlucin-like [Anoplophora glabripennis]|uniref:perlucin-like n=1 Tax=Anoplophora glabripennis TaxID=217634 RepID=UPI0008755559|nr:perlucin-like [Anoplophora glabripennis]
MFGLRVLSVFSVILVPIILTAKIETDWFETLKGERAPRLPLLEFDHKSYYLGIIFKGSYFQAEQFCRYHGMQLLSITSAEENDFLGQNVIKMGLSTERFWTSGSRLPDGKTWVWMSTGRPFSFNNWFPGEPNNAKEYNEQCVETKINKDELKWNDVNCTRQLYFICEISWPTDCYKLLEKINSTQVSDVNLPAGLIDVRIQP